MARNEAKIRFTAATEDFTASIKQANSTLTALRAGLSLNEAQFKNTGDAAEYLKNKHDILEKELKANKDKQEALNQKLEVAKKIYGENSNETQNWQNKITKARTEEQKLITELNQCEKEMEEMADATEEAGEAAEEAKGGWTMAKSILADLAKDDLSAVINKLKEAAKAVIELGTEFTASMSNVAALSGATSKELANLEATAKELGRSTIFSAKDVSDAFGYMSLAGWDTSQMLEGIDGVLNLAAASGMDLAKASDMVTDYLSAFGLEASDAAGMVDLLAYAQANSNTTTEQLGEAFGNSAAQMHTAGQSMETTTAILEAFANQGMKGSEAGTALSAMVRDITQKMKDGKIMIGDTAVTVQDANGNFRDMTDILADVEKATDGMGTAEKSAALMTTFTARSVKGVSMALTEGSDTIKGYKKDLEGCTGTAEEMTRVMNDNLAGDMKALNSATEGLGLALFDYFEGPLRGAEQVATDVINKITDVITPQKSVLESFIDDIGASNDKVRESIENVQNTMSGMESNIGELEAYKNVLLDLNGKTELTEFEHYQLKDAVDKLSESVPELAEAYDETSGKLALTNDELTELIENAETAAIKNAVIKAQSEAYEALADAIVNAAKADSAFEKAQSEYTAIAEKNNATVNAGTNAYGDYFKEVTEAGRTVEAARQEQEKANKNMADAQDQIDGLSGAYDRLAKQYGLNIDATEGVTEATKKATKAGEEYGLMTAEEIEASEELKKAQEGAAKKIQEAYENMRDSIRTSMQDSVSFMQEFSGGTEITAEEIQHNLQTQIEGITNWRDNIIRLSQEAGKGMSQEMYDALVEMGPSAANLVQELVDTLDDNTPQFEDICAKWTEAMQLSESADTLASYTTAGKNAANASAEGFEEGASEMTDAAKDAAEDTASAVDKGLNSAVDATKTQTGNMTAAAQSGANSAADAFRTAVDDIPLDTQSAMSRAVAYVQGGIEQIRSALGVTLRGPNIEVPHFSMSGAFNAKTNSVPVVSVNWWDTGAIFTKPTIIPTMAGYQGVAERRMEAVLPIEVLQDYIADAMETQTNEVNVYMTVNGSENPEDFANRFVRQLQLEMRAG